MNIHHTKSCPVILYYGWLTGISLISCLSKKYLDAISCLQTRYFVNVLKALTQYEILHALWYIFINIISHEITHSIAFNVEKEPHLLQMSISSKLEIHSKFCP